MRFQTRRDVENHFDGNIGEGWPVQAVEFIADEIIDAAHDRGLYYGDDWSDVLAEKCEGDDWVARIVVKFIDNHGDEISESIKTE